MNSTSNSLKLLRVLLAICWWATWIAAGCGLIVGILTLVDPGGWLDLDLVGRASNFESLQVSATTRDGLPVMVELSQPTLVNLTFPASYWGERRLSVLVLGLGVYLSVALFLLFLHQLRLILGSVESGNPFIPENARRLRIMGILILVGEVCRSIFTLALSGYADWALQPKGFNLNGHLSFDFSMIMIGLSVIVLSEVFRHGASMREEQQLTI